MEINKISDTCIEIILEDSSHTIGNIIQKELQQYDVFAGYKCPHPLESRLVFKIISDCPKKSVKIAVDSLLTKLDELSSSLSL